MADAYMTERWERIAALGRPSFSSYIGRVPWVTAPEYRHLQTVGGNADVAGPLSLIEALSNLNSLGVEGASESNVRAALSALSLGIGLATMAREESNNVAVHPPWIAISAELWRELETWEEVPATLRPFAALAGEYADVFASRLPDRLSLIIAAFQSTGYYLGVMNDAVAAAARLGEAGVRAKDRRAIADEPL